MSGGDALAIESSGTSEEGLPRVDLLTFEERHIVIARGAEFHDENFPAGTFEYDWKIFPYLQNHLGANFQVHADGTAEYTSNAQRVHYFLRETFSKQGLKQALETDNLHVIYYGHSRYGRGTCFDERRTGLVNHGEHWEDGTSASNGIFRLGHPFVAVDLEDLHHHEYTCRPMRVEDPAPDRSERDAEARRGLERILMPADLRGFVAADHASPSNLYWGYRAGRSTNLLFRAGWTGTRAQPLDLGATDLRCKAFCHFGCDSRDHFWEIVRSTTYKGWTRPDPPTDHYAYFTTNLSDCRTTPLWLRNLLTYSRDNAFQPWWNSLQHAKQRTNAQLGSYGADYRVY